MDKVVEVAAKAMMIAHYGLRPMDVEKSWQDEGHEWIEVAKVSLAAAYEADVERLESTADAVDLVATTSLTDWVAELRSIAKWLRARAAELRGRG